MATKPRISFEYFPPKTEVGRERLLTETTPALNALNPEFFSVTYGAGGSTRDNTLGIVSDIASSGSSVAPHLSFGSDSEETIGALLDTYRDRNISRMVALRGDIPSGMGGASQLVYANQLVEFIRKRTGDHFEIEVAAYPEIPRWICQRIESYGTDQDSIRKFGIEVVTQLCQTLLENGSPGLHFYTMNQVEPTREIFKNLGL